MNDDIIRGHDMIEGLNFFDPRKFKRYFTVDNEPVYVPIDKSTDESTGEQAPVSPNDKRCNTGKMLPKSPDECIYYTADDIAEMLGASKSKAYKIIQSLNEELKKQKYIVQAGRVSKQFFHENYYGLEKREQKK